MQWFLCRPKPTYDVSVRQLEASYKGLQKTLHPDKFGRQGAQQQEYSAEQSSLVNRAYTTLKSPLHRAVYLVSVGMKSLYLYQGMRQL